MQGSAALRRGDLREAVIHFEAAVQAAPESSEARRMLGMAPRHHEQNHASAEQLAIAVRLNGRDDRGPLALADTFAGARRTKDAERVLLDALSILPCAARVHYRLARLYESAERPADAIRQIELTHAFHSLVGQDDLLDRLATILHSQGDLDGAAAAFLQRIGANPSNADAHR